MTSAPQLPDGDVVEVRVPADGGYVSTVRMAAAGLAARCDLTIDDIEDLRLAVDEACALLLPHAVDGSTLDAHFQLHPGALHVAVIVSAGDGAQPDRSGYAWTVLGALVGPVSVEQRGDRLEISLTKRREVLAQ